MNKIAQECYANLIQEQHLKKNPLGVSICYKKLKV